MLHVGQNADKSHRSSTDHTISHVISDSQMLSGAGYVTGNRHVSGSKNLELVQIGLG
jgi:hypothetical protein